MRRLAILAVGLAVAGCSASSRPTVVIVTATPATVTVTEPASPAPTVTVTTTATVTVTAAPVTPRLTVDQAKAQCNVQTNEEDGQFGVAVAGVQWDKDWGHCMNNLGFTTVYDPGQPCYGKAGDYPTPGC